MSYTFGAGTGDDITSTIGVSTGGDNTLALVAGWFYPTTLTATRALWSWGNTTAGVIDTTTSELRVILAAGTTPGQYTTTGAGLVVNTWSFLAWLISTETTGPVNAVRIWAGNETNLPTELTITLATTPVGTPAGTASKTVGNKGTGTLAFQGDIGWISFFGIQNIFFNSFATVETSGTITQGEADNTLERWVKPLWLGCPRVPMFTSSIVAASAFSVVHFPLNGTVAYGWSNSPNPDSEVEFTVNGATLSQNTPPTAPPANWPHLHPFVPNARR